MARTALIVILCVLTMGLASAYAYEFKLLNGMTVKGALKSFKDGRFYLDTEYGQVDIDADKLDYVIVEETDPGPSGGKGARKPGIGLGPDYPGIEKVASSQGGEAPVPCPQPLSGRSIAPAPLAGRSVGPAPLLGRSIVPAPLMNRSVGERPASFGSDAGKAYPGLFRGRVE